MLRKLLALSLVTAVISVAIATNTAQAQRLKPPHFSGWSCIHHGEGTWTADTGNGYFGGLQMSYDWMGVIRGKASWYPPLDQMWAAETESAKYSFSYRWMRQQWPNTYPPCSRFFSSS